MYLLLTNLVSEVRKPKPHRAVLAWPEAHEGTWLHLAAVTMGEIQIGIERTRQQDEARTLELEAWLSLVAETYKLLPMNAMRRPSTPLKTKGTIPCGPRQC